LKPGVEMPAQLAAVPIDDGRCFACGPQNTAGLQLCFDYPDDRHAHACIRLAPRFQGWKEIAHGGIAMALLDEGMAHAAAAAGYRGVTAKLDVRFRAPVPLEREVEIFGEVVWIRRNVLAVRAEVREEAEVLVEAEGYFVAKGRVTDVVDFRSNRGEE